MPIRKFILDSVFATLFIFLVLWGLQSISQLRIFNALDPISQALEDTELTDYAFSELRTEDPPIDTNIIIVNTGELSRELVGRQIEILSTSTAATAMTSCTPNRATGRGRPSSQARSSG